VAHGRAHARARQHAGFLAGRRFVDWNLDRYRYFTLYEGKELETFSSAEYRRRLNNPTEWTFRMQPNFLNFRPLRMPDSLHGRHRNRRSTGHHPHQRQRRS
jgi:hypothetical protein